MPRKPEPNVEVFNLGHYEQMQIELAIVEAIEVNADLEPDERAVDIDTLRNLRSIFQAFGTMSIIRTNEQDGES